MKIRIEKNQSEEAEQLVNFLRSKGVYAVVIENEVKSMSGHSAVVDTLIIEVPNNE